VTVAVDKIQQARGDLKADTDLVLFGQIFRASDVVVSDGLKESKGKGISGSEGVRELRESMPEVLDGDNSGAILTSVYTFVARDGRGMCMGI
jgi:hypothetical protein